MKYIIRNEEGKWYKGNLHMHTTCSDGHLSPEEAILIYKKNDYDFISITDHRKLSKEQHFEGMLLIPGAEWDFSDPVYHILSIGTESDFGYSEGCSIRELIVRINESGGIAILAHPAWSLMNPDEMMNLDGFAAAEIYNSVSAAPWNANRADSSQYFDLWAAKGKIVPAVASDDSHWYTGEQTKSYTMVQAEALNTRSIIDAIKAGKFYASQGPRFYEISYDEDKVCVKFSDEVKRVIVYSNSVWVDQRVYDNPNGEIVYYRAKSDKFVRIELIDGTGNRAWSSPFLLE